MKWNILLTIFIFLTACGGGGGSLPEDKVRVTCADVYNAGDIGQCSSAIASYTLGSIAYAAITNIDAGTISRGQLIYATQEIINPLASEVSIWLEMAFDAGCGGALTWEIIPKQEQAILAGQTFNITVSGQCSDMPLGSRTLTAIAWETDGITEIGRVIVSFNLVE